jgi:hypothetical protein
MIALPMVLAGAGVISVVVQGFPKGIFKYDSTWFRT